MPKPVWPLLRETPFTDLGMTPEHMSYLCYTLDEAAQQLGMSETVLFRLSQFLKVPANAYDDVGYIAFNGDLSFNDSDLAFFRQVKERLLAGETLETIKQRLRHNDGHQQKSTIPLQPQAAVPQQFQAPALADPSATPPIQNIETDQHLKREADKSFHRYKAENRPKLNQVFQNLAQNLGHNIKKQVENLTPKLQTAPASSEYRPIPNHQAPIGIHHVREANQQQVAPLWTQPVQPSFQQSMPHLIPVQPAPAMGQMPASMAKPEIPTVAPSIYRATEAIPTTKQAPAPNPSIIQPASQAPALYPLPSLTAQPEIKTSAELPSGAWGEDPWEAMIQSASNNPRALNVRLRAAAQTIRQKAIQQIQQKHQPEARS